MEQLHIFVSHSSQDKAIADRFVHGLREAGADVWYDEHNLGAGHLKNEIMRELELRPIFLVLLSKAAFASGWVKKETDWADELDDRDPSRLMLPVTIGPIERSDFSGANGWLFLHSYKRIEAPGYQPYPITETIERTCRSLGLTPAGAAPISNQPQESAEDLLVRAKALIAQEQFVEAIPFLERVTQQAPQRIDGWVNLSHAYSRTERYTEGLQAGEHTLTLDPSNARAWNIKGYIFNALDRYEEALLAVEQSLALDPAYAKAWNNKGCALNWLGRHEEALTALDKALLLDPTYGDAWNNKGWVLNDLKRYEEALVALDQALTLDPSDDIAWDNKAYALRALGKVNDANEAKRHAKALQKK